MLRFIAPLLIGAFLTPATFADLPEAADQPTDTMVSAVAQDFDVGFDASPECDFFVFDISATAQPPGLTQDFVVQGTSLPAIFDATHLLIASDGIAMYSTDYTIFANGRRAREFISGLDAREGTPFSGYNAREEVQQTSSVCLRPSARMLTFDVIFNATGEKTLI